MLHFGDVLYGNIGTARRLDFTVVDSTVNELSRIEALGKALGRGLLLSESIAHRCGQPVLSLGPHELRGIAGARDVCRGGLTGWMQRSAHSCTWPYCEVQRGSEIVPFSCGFTLDR